MHPMDQANTTWLLKSPNTNTSQPNCVFFALLRTIFFNSNSIFSALLYTAWLDWRLVSTHYAPDVESRTLLLFIRQPSQSRIFADNFEQRYILNNRGRYDGENQTSDNDNEVCLSGLFSQRRVPNSYRLENKGKRKAILTTGEQNTTSSWVK